MHQQLMKLKIIINIILINKSSYLYTYIEFNNVHT